MFFLRFFSNRRGRADGFKANYFSIPEVTSTSATLQTNPVPTTTSVVSTLSTTYTTQVISKTMETTPSAPSFSIVSTKAQTSRVQVLPTSAEYTGATSLFPSISYSSSLVTTVEDSITSDVPSKVILVTTFSGLLIGLFLIVGLLIFCLCKSNERKTSAKSEGNSQNIDTVTDPHTHHNGGFDAADGFEALRISSIDGSILMSKTIADSDIKADSEMKSTSSFLAAKDETKPHQLQAHRENKNYMLSSSGEMTDQGIFVENVAYESYDKEHGDENCEEIERNRCTIDDGFSGQTNSSEMVTGHKYQEDKQWGMINNVVYENYVHGEETERVNRGILEGNEVNEDSDEGSVDNVLYESYEQDKHRQPEENDVTQTNQENEDRLNAMYENYERNMEKEANMKM